MHDKTYIRELSVSNAANGYRDILAKVDINSFRRIPWEEESGFPGSQSEKKGVPFFLIYFLDPDTYKPIAPDPRGFLKTQLQKVAAHGWKAMSGG